MKRITKIFVILGLSCTLMTTPAFFAKETGREVYATGFPTIDISNLLMKICDMLMQGEGVAMDIAEITHKVQEFKKVIEWIRVAANATQSCIELINLGNYVNQEWEFIKELKEYYMSIECDAAIIYATAGLASECWDIASDMITDFTKKKTDFVNLISGGNPDSDGPSGDYGNNSASSVSKAISDEISLICAEVYRLCHNYERRVAMIHRFQQSVERVKDDQVLRNMFFY